MNTSIHQFVRADRRRGSIRPGDPVGLTLATVIDGVVHIGWSKTNTDAGDHFDKEKAILAASGRASKGTRKILPHLVRRSAEDLARRARNYFKVEHVVVAGNGGWIEF